ncbi:hypothetical protein BDZ89DRAFT_1107913 [Hymenopellis radicata]|nr:hypothetical protein BDZ89DRAFT_1107913 [Hymenopellis radicata]
MSVAETANSGASAQPKEDKAAMVEIKNSKLVFRQKPMSLDKQSETLQEIVQFRSMLQERVEKQEGPLIAIPEQYQPVIAKLAFESDKTLSTLSKNIHQELLPIQDGDGTASDPLSMAAVEAVIKATMTRNNYGIDPIAGTKLPASFSVWRWDLKDPYHGWLPSSICSKAQARLAERIEMKRLLNDLFAKLSVPERDAMIGSKGAVSKPPLKNNTVNDPPIVGESDHVDGQTPKPKVGRPKKEKVLDPKDIEKMEKKAAKAEKERKEKEAQSKSRSLMANFFAKGHRSTPSESKPGTSSAQTDYERTFKPFVTKKDTIMAPTNVFREKAKVSASGTADDVIIVDDLDEISVAPTRRPARTRPISSRQSSGQESVRDLVTQLSEAEVTGDTNAVRALLAKLSDRSIIPAKVFIFKEDARPGYFGTWTRTSSTIRPRRPFDKDVIHLDYGYDSGEEWEEEPAGDADDVHEDEDDDGDGDEADSDMDSWLVDDDEDEGPVSLDQMDLDLPNVDLPRPQKRKIDESEKSLSKKRKVVVPLVPFVKGPFWEPSVGQCVYEPFNAYRIRLFNDTSLPIDPFNDVVAPAPSRRAKAETRPNEAVFAVPPVPIKADISQMPASSSVASTTPISVTKRPAPVAKTVFPDTYLPTLIDKVASLQTGNLTFLVEAVHQDLRVHKVKKNAIEAKIKEVGEKCKQTKTWRLKPDFMPLTPSPSSSVQA